MAKVFECTICGDSFGSPEGTRGHIQGSRGDHQGIGFADAQEYISETQYDPDSDGDPDADPPGGAASPASSPSSPSKDAGLGVPQRKRPQAQAEPKDDPECPECGSNRWFDASKHTDYSYGCADCSDRTSWQVFNA